MLDIRVIRENPELVRQASVNKSNELDVAAILELDDRRRELIADADSLKAERNAVSAEIPKKKKAGEPVEEVFARMREVGDRIAELDERLRVTESQLAELQLRAPNIPHESVQVGNEAENKIVRDWGVVPEFDFDPLPHWEIGPKLGILDLEAGARVSGSGFYFLKGAGARLQRALISYMLDTHVADGFTEISAPHLVNSGSMTGTGQLPKMKDDMYEIERDELWLIPTGEVPVTNMHRNEILPADSLPLSYVAYTPCFRREAGSAGKDTRGMIRVHQFDKVEMVKFVKPETSYDELEILTLQAEKILRGLEIPYRVLQLATGDLSFASSKTYDLELWAAGARSWLEISSVSNFESFQARRMNTRFRTAEKKVDFPHTLNGSGLALARLIPAILENFQTADGKVVAPAVLHPYMGGLTVIE
ncbi:MAG: serine--tRNA ligase [Candidatus Zixiibacteriota bacterium]